jgi:hypothetical protein
MDSSLKIVMKRKGKSAYGVCAIQGQTQRFFQGQ